MLQPDDSISTTVRRLTADNVDEIRRFLPAHLTTVPVAHVEAVQACRVLLRDGSMVGIVVDVTDSNGHRTPAGVGGAVFVSKRFAEAERAHPRPGLAERVLASVSEDRSVALPRRAIAAANQSGGLHVAVILHHWMLESSEALQKEIRHHLVASFISDMRGYRLVEIIGELSRDEDMSWATSGGFRIRSDYADRFMDQAHPQPRRYLIGITRDEALRTEGSVMSMLFHYTPPRFAFTAAQRRLLTEAMQHKTDAEIASALHVSLSAVKKTWAAIFDRASAVVESSPASPIERQSDRTVRGVQKRHRLLTYLLDHPEELRP